jgi:hypothetical protein
LGNVELDLEGLVREVLARNPSIAQMQAAWQAASASSHFSAVNNLHLQCCFRSFQPQIVMIERNHSKSAE